MTLEVLQTREQIAEGRCELRRRRISFATPQWKSWLRRHGLAKPGIQIGDELKSWDVLKTAQFIETHLAKDAAILDIGAFGSELPPLLWALGYRRVSGIDLNPAVGHMPFAGSIDYRVANFLAAPYPDHSFDAVTAISVIEHGFDGEILATQLARLLRPRGYFIASFDYWPEKISTAGMRMFDMSWTIFSRQDVQEFLRLCEHHDLAPCGPLQFEVPSPSISYAGKQYTFAWLVLQLT